MSTEQTTPDPLPADVKSLQALVGQLQDQVEFIQKNQVAVLSAENQLLRQKIQLLLQRFFGNRKNESIDPAQLELLLQGLEETVVVPPKAPESKPKKVPRESGPKRHRLPDHLPTQDIVIEPPEIQEAPEQWRELGQEVTEELEYVPAQLIKKRYVRKKYVHRQEPGRIVIGALPPRAIDKGIAGPGLLTQIALAKYVDHQPLYRQEKQFRERFGVALSRKTMASWVWVIAHWLSGIHEKLKENLIGGGYLQVDETPIKYLDPQIKGKSQQGYLWTYSRPGGPVVYDWQNTRGKKAPHQWLKGYEGDLQSDGYNVYASLAKNDLEIRHHGCWAHVRRPFTQALEERPKTAGWFVRQIGHLYAIEKKLRLMGASPKLRVLLRQNQSQPILKRIERAALLLSQKPQILPQSLTGKALAYLRNQWSTLEGYVDNGVLEIDNNLVENAIRPTALGKKNWLFFGSKEAGWQAAVIYSVLESCRRYQVEPYAYLRDVLTRLPSMNTSQVEEILPWNWKPKDSGNPTTQPETRVETTQLASESKDPS